MKSCLFSLMHLLCLFIPLAHADERILRFHSDITVHQDSTMTVKETIKVQAEGIQIKRGIYRDFPTIYKDSRGNPYHVGFRVISVTRNGSPEPFHITGLSNGKRVYVGEEKTFLNPGEYTYAITYATEHQLGFFPEFDELYWNVTGNGWAFSIDKASAEIHLPADAAKKVISTAGYSGPQGAQGGDFDEQRLPSGSITFSTTRSLGPREGLTVAVSWPKGYVAKPLERSPAPEGEEAPHVSGVSCALLGLLILVGYYLLVWFRVGKDPAAGIIVVRYAPPSDMSPAVMRYITRMGYDDKGFAAELINMAVKGCVSIQEDGGEYVVRKKEVRVPLSTEEKKISGHLFGAEKEIRLIKKNHAYIGGAIKELNTYLQQKYEKLYFLTNRTYFLTGLLLTAFLLFASGFSMAQSKLMVFPFVFICIWLTIWSTGVIVLVREVVKKWKAVIKGRSSGVLNVAGALFLTIFSLPFIGGEIAGIVLLAHFTSLVIVIFLIAAMAVNYAFFICSRRRHVQAEYCSTP